MTERPIGDDDLQAALDGRLPGARAASLAAYLDANPDVARRQRADEAYLRDLRERLQPISEETLPARLRPSLIMARQARRRRTYAWQALAASLLFVIGGTIGWSLRSGVSPRDPTNAAVSAYNTFTPDMLHPVEVRAGETQQLVQWLSDRLDRQIVPPDLSKQGFRLMGGRILPDGDRQAALLMYDDDHGTRLTIYLRRGTVDGTDLRYSIQSGVETFYSSGHDLTYAISARTDRARLLDVSREIERQLQTTVAKRAL